MQHKPNHRFIGILSSLGYEVESLPGSGGLLIKVKPRRERLIDRALEPIATEPLQEFLAAVLSEPVVHATVMQPYPSKPAPAAGAKRTAFQTAPIAQLRRAGELANTLCMFSRQERDVLYVATLLRGIQEVLAARVVFDGCTPADILRDIARPALHRLEDEAPWPAQLLRLALGWGNEDEMDNEHGPLAQAAVRQALRLAGLLPSSGSTNGLPH